MRTTALKPLFAAVLLLATTTPGGSQDQSPSADRVRWLKEHAVGVRTVDPTDEDFSDLQPLKKALKGVRVVMLGEMGHGVGTTFLAKSRLIKFLHREMGFDVLAFEAGFYAVPKAWAQIREGEDSVTASRRALFRNGAFAEEKQELLRYIGRVARSGRPLEITGVDPQLSGSLSVGSLPHDLATFLKKIGVSGEILAEGAPFRTALLGMSAAMKYQVPPVTFVPEVSALRQEIVGSYATGALPPQTAREARFWIQMLRGVETMARERIRQAQKRPPPTLASWETRSVQMGENLLWLLRELYPERKVMVSAASTHTPVSTRQTWDGTQLITMGQVVREALGPAVYGISFEPYTGTSGNPNWISGTWAVDDYRSELADLLNRAGFQQAFVDVRRPAPGGEWLRKPMLRWRSPKKHQLRQPIQASADAVFFIHTERPVTAAVR